MICLSLDIPTPCISPHCSWTVILIRIHNHCPDRLYYHCSELFCNTRFLPESRFAFGFASFTHVCSKWSDTISHRLTDTHHPSAYISGLTTRRRAFSSVPSLARLDRAGHFVYFFLKLLSSFIQIFFVGGPLSFRASRLLFCLCPRAGTSSTQDEHTPSPAHTPHPLQPQSSLCPVARHRRPCVCTKAPCLRAASPSTRCRPSRARHSTRPSRPHQALHRARARSPSPSTTSPPCTARRASGCRASRRSRDRLLAVRARPQTAVRARRCRPPPRARATPCLRRALPAHPSSAARGTTRRASRSCWTSAMYCPRRLRLRWFDLCKSWDAGRPPVAWGCVRMHI